MSANTFGINCERFCLIKSSFEYPIIVVISLVILLIVPILFGFNDTVKMHVLLFSLVLAFQSEKALVEDVVF